MSYSYYIEEDDDQEFILERKDIDDEDDPETLAEWVRGLEDRSDRLSMQIEAFRQNPKEDRESLLWLRRIHMAKAATGIGLTRLQQRRVKLGLVENPLQTTINALNAKLTNAKAEIEELKSRKKAAA